MYTLFVFVLSSYFVFDSDALPPQCKLGDACSVKTVAGSLLQIGSRKFGGEVPEGTIADKAALEFKPGLQKPALGRGDKTVDRDDEAATIPYRPCSIRPHGCTKGACMCHPNRDEKYPFIKVINGECSRCLRQCPNYPRGTPQFCTCPLGCTSGSYVRNKKRYRHCKCAPPVIEKTPTRSPTPAPTTPPPTPAPTESTSAHSGVRPDGNKNCKWYKDLCGRDEWVTKTCQTTCAKGTSSVCEDGDAKCGLWKEYCVEGWFIHGKPLSELCKKTCGGCGSS